MTVADDTQPDTLSYLVFSQQPFLSTGEHSTLLAVVLVFIVCHSVRIIIKVEILIYKARLCVCSSPFAQFCSISYINISMIFLLCKKKAKHNPTEVRRRGSEKLVCLSFLTATCFLRLDKNQNTLLTINILNVKNVVEIF